MNVNTLDQIKNIIGKEFGVDPSVLIGKRQSDYISKARHVLSYTLYNMGMNTIAIGKIIGKDHTTVLHSKKVYNNLYDTDKYFKIIADTIESKVEALIFGSKGRSKPSNIKLDNLN